MTVCARRLRQALGQHGEPLGLSETQLLLLWTCREKEIREHRACKEIGTGTSQRTQTSGKTAHCAEPVPVSSQGQSQRELAAALGVSTPQVSQLVEQLRGQRLIHGRRDPRDRRRQQWQLTHQGRQVLTSVLDALSDWVRNLERIVPPADQRALAATRGRIAAASDTAAPEQQDPSAGIPIGDQDHRRRAA